MVKLKDPLESSEIVNIICNMDSMEDSTRWETK